MRIGRSVFFLPVILRTVSASSSPVYCSRSVSYMMTAPPPVVIQARKEHLATMIFLHGIGDQADGWSDMFERGLRHDNIKYILPNAPVRPITRWKGEQMPAWFDRLAMGLDAQEDTEGIEETAKILREIIEKEVSDGIPTEKVIIGGFSQGGAMAIYTGLTHPTKLGGIVCLSSYLVLRDRFPGACSANSELPIFIAHGTHDQVVPLEWGQNTHQLVSAFNKNCKLHIYRGLAHTSCPQEMRDMKQFISNVVHPEAEEAKE